MAHTCKCGMALNDPWVAEVRRYEGIGNRAVWEILPEEWIEDDPNDSEDCSLMCRNCGRIYDMIHTAEGLDWKLIDRVDPQTMRSVAD